MQKRSSKTQGLYRKRTIPPHGTALFCIVFSVCSLFPRDGQIAMKNQMIMIIWTATFITALLKKATSDPNPAFNALSAG